MKRFLLSLFLLSAPALHAAVIYSGTVNIPIPTDFDGIYVDFDNGATSTTTFAGADLNLTYGGLELYNESTFQFVRASTSNDDPVLNLTFGTVVNTSISFYATGAGFSDGHTGFTSTQFEPGVSGYFGFQFTDNSSNGPYYGWVAMTVDGINGGRIESWAFDNTGAALAVGTTAIPEPSTSAVLAGLIAVTLVAQRRRSAPTIIQHFSREPSTV